MLNKTLKTDPATGRGEVAIKVDDDEGGAYILRVAGTDRFGNPVVADRAVTISGKKDETRLRILTDRTKTAFYFVVIPEQMILIDTKKAAELFARFDVPIGGYVVNRVIPEELGEQQIPAYLRNRIAMQKRELDQIRGAFGNQVLGYVPELERDVTGLPMIERVAGLLYGS